MDVAHRWSSRPGVERFDLSTRTPLYLVSAQEPVALVLLLNGQGFRPLGAGVLLVVTVAHTVACLAVLREALDHRIGGPRPRAGLVAAASMPASVSQATILSPCRPSGWR